MRLAGLTIRQATPHEIIMDGITNPADMWFTHRIDLDSQTVARVATALWGKPGHSMANGELMWRLRAGEGHGFPVYISVGFDTPTVLFSSAAEPDAPETLVAQIRGMLVARDTR